MSVLHRAFQLHSYKQGLGGLSHTLTARAPPLTTPDSVLIKVKAASVNPLDVWMTQGYGWALFDALRGFSDQELPLVLGRDFSGVVVDKAMGCDGVKVGDEVWGSRFPSKTGTHAEYIVASQCEVSQKPSTLSHLEAASIPYSGLTALSALCVSGEMLGSSSRKGKRVLVLGASGGVGHLAVQILKAWGSKVVGVCGSDSHEMISSLGADSCIDYKDPIFKAKVAAEGDRGYDIILDCSGGDDTRWQQSLLPWSNAKYITLTSPLLKEQNTRGLLYGTASSLASLVRTNALSYKNRGSGHRWAYYMPVPSGMQQLGRMAEEGKLKPHLAAVFPFSKASEAYAKVEAGHLRGKVVISMEEEIKEKSIEI